MCSFFMFLDWWETWGTRCALGLLKSFHGNHVVNNLLSYISPGNMDQSLLQLQVGRANYRFCKYCNYDIEKVEVHFYFIFATLGIMFQHFYWHICGPKYLMPFFSILEVFEAGSWTGKSFKSLVWNDLFMTHIDGLAFEFRVQHRYHES